MADRTHIAWSDATWQPVVGCTKVSPGCTNCYAERMAYRLAAMGQPRYKGLAARNDSGESTDSRPRWTGAVRCVSKVLEQPLRWSKPRRVFVCSMGDLFHKSVPDEHILRVFNVMRQCPQHTFQVLTKRAERMADFCRRVRFDNNAGDDGHIYLADTADGRGWRLMGGGGCSGMPWVWVGVTAEDQQRADERIPHLLATPAAVRFVSVEPMLGRVDLERWICDPEPRLDQVIVGAESGPGARECLIGSIEAVEEQCRMFGVACFVKQVHLVDDHGCWRLSKDMAEWPVYLRVQQFPEASHA